MNNLIYLISFAVFSVVGAVIFYFLIHLKRQKSELSSLSDKMTSQLNEITNQVNLRLKENFEMMQRQNQDLNSRLDNTQRVVQSVTNKLSSLEEASKRIFEVGKDISSLHDILRAPKLRGGLGEYLLANILEQILPQENYALQYAFKNGEIVDAAIKLRDMIIPVDSKFSFENFQKMAHAKTKDEKLRLKKQFLRDVKKHIDSIADKYIRPDEGTSDFALMYIPAENVYYEVVLKEKNAQDIIAYALAKKVIPVSPNSFYAYLQAILIGLKGLRIEKGAKEILMGLSRLKIEFQKFGQDFELLGKHLSHASSVYQSGERKLEKFNDRLTRIAAIKQKNLPLPKEDSSR